MAKVAASAVEMVIVDKFEADPIEEISYSPAMGLIGSSNLYKRAVESCTKGAFDDSISLSKLLDMWRLSITPRN